MPSWVDVLRLARNSLASQDPPRPASDSTPASLASESGIPTALRILRSVAEGTALGDLENIYFNLDSAAMYLVRLLSEPSECGRLADLASGNFAEEVIAYR